MYHRIAITTTMLLLCFGLAGCSNILPDWAKKISFKITTPIKQTYLAGQE
jgi:hypothetical protein